MMTRRQFVLVAAGALAAGCESLDVSAGEPAAPDNEAADSRRERRSLVERALARLPGAQARLLEAFHFERAPVGRIADSMGVSERAVEGRLRRARQNLRKQIEADSPADGDER